MLKDLVTRLAWSMLEGIVDYLDSDITVVTHEPRRYVHTNTEVAISILTAQLEKMLVNGQTIGIFVCRTRNTRMGALAFYPMENDRPATMPILFSGPPDKIRTIARKLEELLSEDHFAPIRPVPQID